jgi:hypothetical protein
MRIANTLITIGIILVLISFAFGPYSSIESTAVECGKSSGFLIGTSTDLHIVVTPIIGNGSEFSMYFLDAIDANNTVVRNLSINLVTPLFVAENMTSFNDVIKIPHPGMYALVFMSSEDTYLLLSVRIDYLRPNFRTLWAGIFVITAGIVILVASRLRYRMHMES